jgi:hypothetical protein
MIDDGRAYTDNTILKSAASCSMQLTLRHVLHWANREAVAPLRAGHALHEALAELNFQLIRGATLNIAQYCANQIFTENYKSYSDEFIPSDDRFYYDNLATIIDEWIVTRQERLPWIVTDKRLIEVGFAYPLDDSGLRLFFGRMDLVGRDRRDASWVVVDHKSTGRLDAAWAESWGLDSQLTGYFWSALQHVPNLRGFYINGIEFSRLPTSDKKCPTHGLKYHECSRAHLKANIVGPVTRTPEAMEKWRNDAIRLNDKYRYYAETYDPADVGTTPDLSAVEMEGPFTSACRFCEFREWCRLGQRVETLPALFVQDEWMPYDPREFDQATAAELVVDD